MPWENQEAGTLRRADMPGVTTDAGMSELQKYPELEKDL
jgi:hypothetical protein